MTKRLSKQGTSSSTKFRKKKFTSVKNGPLFWIDFTDKRTVYKTASLVQASPGDGIWVVDNKAYDKRFGKAGNSAIGTSLVQGNASYRPTFIVNPTLGLTCAKFDGSNDRLVASTTSGNVDTGRLSDSRLEGQNMTVFWVAKNDSTTPGTDWLLTISAYDASDGTTDPLQLGTQMNNYHIFMGDASDKSGDVNQSSGRQATTNIELWTFKCAGSSGAYMYANGDISDGITNGTTKNHGYRLDANNAGTGIDIGNASWDGDVYEILIFDQALPDKEIKEIERQLKQKYSIT